VIKSVTGEEITFEDLGGAMTHNAKSGVAHFACESDEDAIGRIKELLSYLPSNNMEDPPIVASGDDPGRTDPVLDTVIPDNPNQSYDMKEIIGRIVDKGEFFEPHEFYAQNIIVCFARLNGRSVGIIANQPQVLAGCLDIDASDKATRFIRFCDAFNIPLLTIADVPGYLPGSQQEWSGIIRHGAKLLWCYSEATVPKLLLVTRKDYGGSYLAMCSKDLGADMAFAWPSAEIAVMGASGACNIIHRRAIKGADDPEAKRAELIAEYEQLFSNPYCAASRGYIDGVIVPSETRPRLIEALEIMCSKRETLPPKKHGNIPL
jgi:methylmalonyl-CoA decarboxylase subunit alpha